LKKSLSFFFMTGPHESLIIHSIIINPVFAFLWLIFKLPYSDK